MANVTSIQSGYWSNPSTWDTGSVPANGDTVTISSGHTVIFDVDQSGFSTGLAGLTISGILKMPSQAEGSNMPNFVCLKVNTSITGTGSLLVGSSTYPITYPQSVKIMVNGTITVTTFNCYGEQRWPAFDYLAQDAAANATQIVLTEGMPLVAGDVIAIGRSDVYTYWTSGDNFTYTVTAYNPHTKTVTISPALTKARRGGFPYGCLVLLLTRPIILSKYGTNNVTLISGSNRYLEGVMFINESGATVHSFTGVSNSVLSYCSVDSGGYLTYGNASDLTISNTVFNSRGSQYCIRDISGSNILSNVALINNAYGLFWCLNVSTTKIELTNIHCQNLASGMFYSSGYGSHPQITIDSVNGLTVKYSGTSICGFHSQNATGFYTFSVGKVLSVNCYSLFGEASPGGQLILQVDNVSVYCDGVNFSITGNTKGSYVVQNVNINIGSGRTATISNKGYSTQPIFRNITIQGAGTGFLGFGASIINCSIQNAGNPLVSNVFAKTVVKNLTVNNYYRPTFATTYFVKSPLASYLNFFDIYGLTINGNSKPLARERIWPYGYVKNQWDARTPAYNNWEFYLTSTSLNGPLFVDWHLVSDKTITIRGNVTQLPNGATLKVQIFSEDKEPILDDTADFERTISSTGSFQFSWTPSLYKQWIIRVSAYLNSTTSPVIVENLSIELPGGTSVVSSDYVFVA
ncbi:MAG: G8 domain-containing protein [Candidatus Aenigmatarchaeota archaeon]